MDMRACPNCGLPSDEPFGVCRGCGRPLSPEPEPANPFAPPKAALLGAKPAAAGGANVWRKGKEIVFAREARLPDRCLVCNGTTYGQRLTKTLYWHSPAWYLLIFLNILIYAIAALIVRKKAIVTMPVCARHLSRRRTAIALGWILGLASLAVTISAFVVEKPEIGCTTFVALLVILVVCSRLAMILSPTRIDDRFVRARGAHADYLATLPEAPAGV
jgi:hypothetical protein